MRKLKNISFSYHSVNKNEWSTPKGIANAFKHFGINVYEFVCKDCDSFQFPSKDFVDKFSIDSHLIFHSGYSRKLEKQIINFKKINPKVLLVIELGDEPQTRNCNFIKAYLSDICLSPDAECTKHWQKKGINCKWWTHWADSEIFYNLNLKRNIFMGTTMGKRNYSFLLKLYKSISLIILCCFKKK